MASATTYPGLGTWPGALLYPGSTVVPEPTGSTSTIDQHTADVLFGLADPYYFPMLVTGLRITMDESWSPFVQAELSAEFPHPDLVDDIDPRGAGRVRISIRRAFGGPWPNKDFTAAFPTPTSNATLTAAYPGYTNAQITAKFAHAYNPAGVRDTVVRSFDLDVRERTLDHLDQSLRVVAMSDEMLLDDYKRMIPSKYVNTETSVRALVTTVLGYIGAELEPGTSDAPLVAGSLEWVPGASGWEFLRTPIEQSGLRLWCDEHRVWRLAPRNPLTPGGINLSTGDGGNLIRVADRINRDGEWADAVVITYRWTDAAGAVQLAYDVAGDPATAKKVEALTREQKNPGAGAAASILRQSKARGRQLDVVAVNDYLVNPGMSATIDLRVPGWPNQPVFTGMVGAVSWELPSAEMSIRTRELADTPSTAWVFDPPGRAWNSIPVGTDWTEDL